MSNKVDRSFGILEGEEEISFEQSFPVHSAIASNSLQDQMVSNHQEIDGYTWGTNGNYNNYTLGSYFASGKFYNIHWRFYGAIFELI